MNTDIEQPDWLLRTDWDLYNDQGQPVTTVYDLVRAVGIEDYTPQEKVAWLRKLQKLPVWDAMPDRLKQQILTLNGGVG